MDRRIQEQLGECKFEEFQPIYMHCLRHTFATRCIENGVKPKALQKMLGHSSPAQTLDYIGITAEEIDEAYRKLNLGSETHNYLVDSNIIEFESKTS